MKTVKYLVLVAVVALMGVTMTSCGGYSNGKAKDMIVKDNDGKLEDADYVTMIEWVEDYNNKYLDEWESVIEDNKEYQDYEFAVTEMNVDFNNDYTYISDIKSILSSADEKVIGKENKEKYDKIKEKYNDRNTKLGEKAPKKNEK